MKKKSLIGIGLLVLCSFQKKKSPVEHNFSSYLESYKDSPGVSLLVFVHGNILFNDAAGYANFENRIPSKADHVYAVGSISKQFTAAAIMQLVERGKLDLNHRINQYFPRINGTITVKHLLEHTSGISDVFLEEKFLKVYGLYLSPEEKMDYVINNITYAFPPGTKYAYSNTGYTLLSRIVEKVSGITFSDYLAQNIFEPLEMLSTSVGNSDKLINNSASGYNIDRNGDFVPAIYLPFDLDWVLGAGNCYSTTEDLLKWIKGLEENNILSQESVNLITSKNKEGSNQKSGNAYGFKVEINNEVKVLKKSGAINGFQSNLVWIPERDIIVIGLTNRVDAAPTFVYKIGEELAGLKN
ncbi:serine hydrolase [Muricauda sp. JGD-17]|uniref:Serine hydrolase n=1 Tax=Flagellimonas ochracea TaxID=2696472 RepID=A0A964WYL3_9FLAO|nr:serine hydrolase domain-containing protein [Allomuricauda ochracea]NAY93341.1 serine hydrolase [Allomuricauda ochracea]